MSAAAKPESPGCIHTIESGRAYAHGPWCDVLRALEARVKELEADSQCDGYAGDLGASAPRCESYRGHPGYHFIRQPRGKP